MFFYSALFVGSVIVALIVLKLINGVVSAGKGAYGAMLSSSKHSTNTHSEDLPYSSLINDAAGRTFRVKPRRSQKRTNLREPAGKPWGW